MMKKWILVLLLSGQAYAGMSLTDLGAVYSNIAKANQLKNAPNIYISLTTQNLMRLRPV
jgi:hypothetical protein